MYLLYESPSPDLEMMQSGVGVQSNGRALTQRRQGLGFPPHHHTHLHTQKHPPYENNIRKRFPIYHLETNIPFKAVIVNYQVSIKT